MSEQTRMNIQLFSAGLLTVLSLFGTSSSCPSVCTCNWNQSDCSDLNQLIPLDFILNRLPPDTTSLTLSQNNFTTVEPGSFSNLSSLIHLDLSRNLLSSLHASSFSQLNSLEFLDLTKNRLVTLPVNLFSDLKRLVELILKDNRLKELDPDQLKGLSKLKRLDLSSNHLRSLPTNLLEGLQNLAWLSVVHNMLSILPQDSLKQATRLHHLLLDENFWNCSCELIPLKHRIEWIVYTGGYVDSVNCSHPKNLQSQDLRNIPTEMFRHCHYLHFGIGNPPAIEGQPGSSGECIRQRYRTVSVRRAAATVAVAGVICGVVCILMVVTATYGCIYAMLAAHKQQQLKQPLMSVKEPEQDLTNEQKDNLMPSIGREAEAPECAGWMAFPPEVCV